MHDSHLTLSFLHFAIPDFPVLHANTLGLRHLEYVSSLFWVFNLLRITEKMEKVTCYSQNIVKELWSVFIKAFTGFGVFFEWRGWSRVIDQTGWMPLRAKDSRNAMLNDSSFNRIQVKHVTKHIIHSFLRTAKHVFKSEEVETKTLFLWILEPKSVKVCPFIDVELHKFVPLFLVSFKDISLDALVLSPTQQEVELRCKDV